MSHAPLGPDPLWYKDAIVYELHVKAFFDSTGDGIGDFVGLTQKLDYLQDLGVTCLWLLPFYPSPLKDDGYDIADYHGVHPYYGTLRDLRSFVREAHRRGLRVITELVINHTSDQHPWFQAARKAPAGSPKRDYYVWSDTDQLYRDARIIFLDTEKSNWTWDPVAKAYYWHRFFSHQPDLNFDNPHVVKAVMKAMRYWLDMGVDGLRLDAIPYLIERDGTNCENLPETHRVLKQLRNELDQHYEGRMLLAEANQWPEDVRPYFGDGDECHMAFHFPLMPRIFMALRQEDRQPIVEIMRRTPPIPENCQWGIFLRNHDELTLEMVTSEERDYMYREYAADPQARLNLGIRRRLAPLVGHSRRRLELLSSLLFSFPGTPVLYYGDEIGMGDNIYLGDRNGVRTPMQWTGDRNAGFSRADFARLYAPPIMDPICGYQAVNVEAQQRDASSLLNWMKRLVALRKRHPTFGRGSIRFLEPANRRVLAYVREHEGESILCVANLSRFVQPVELDLADFADRVPVEMFGRTDFPAISRSPYFLTLGPHSFYWFDLRRAADPAAAPIAAPEPAPALPEVPDLAVGADGPFAPAALEALATTILPGYLARQRWYAGKARRLAGLTVADVSDYGAVGGGARFVLVEARYADGPTDTYAVPMAPVGGDEARAIAADRPGAVIARIVGDKICLLVDATASDRFAGHLLELIGSRSPIAAAHGAFQAWPTLAFNAARGPAAELPVLRSPVEQSNTSFRYGDRLFAKLFRRLEPGINPDLEIGAFLTERTDFDRAPRTAGAVEYRRPGAEPATVLILQEQVVARQTGWEAALESLGHHLQSAKAETPPPGDLAAAGTLGRRTAELHRALATDSVDRAFAPEGLGPADLAALASAARAQVHESLDALSSALGRLPAATADDARRLIAAAPSLLARLEGLDALDLGASPARKIRCHGDYHLGQVLWQANDYVILDFEGEPARPLAERRAKQSPLKDVAGMLRSYDYAASAALREGVADARRTALAVAWKRGCSAAFLDAYRDAMADSRLVPTGSVQFDGLLDALLLQKALYELYYELNNRPDWLPIPLGAVLALAEGGPGGAAQRAGDRA